MQDQAKKNHWNTAKAALLIALVIGSLVILDKRSKLGEAKNGPTTPAAEAIVASMDSCVDKDLPFAKTDADINRVHRQCWNHAKLKQGTKK